MFAQRAKNIVNKPRINEDPKTALIKELKQEIYKLKELLHKTTSSLNLSLYQSNNVSVNLYFFFLSDISNDIFLYPNNNFGKKMINFYIFIYILFNSKKKIFILLIMLNDN